VRIKLQGTRGRVVAAVVFMPALTVSTPAVAQQTATTIPYGQTFVTKHTGTFGGQRLTYTATVKPTVLTDSAGVPAVSFVSISYVRDDVRDPGSRPVIFAFAGGPSNASNAYHMRLLGPKRIMDPEPGREGPGPRLVDNPDGLLDVADIVMVDPAETGFSRILPGGQRSYFFSVNGDCASIEQFMTAWLKERGRESSPRYVMGGSYGSVRTVRIAYDLRKSVHPVDGIIMTANSTMLQEVPGALSVATTLPTLTMTALYHGKIDRAGRTDSAIVEEAYRFAMTDYLGALTVLNDLTPAERRGWAGKLAARTGISADYFLANDLAISRQRFMTELLKDRGLVLNNNTDGRSTTRAGSEATSAPQPDAGPDLFHTYMRDVLKVTYPMTEYAYSAPNANPVWDYAGPPEARTAIGRNDWPKMLRETMELNPKLRVYSANGFYDLQSVLGQARYLFSRTKLPRERIVIHDNAGPHGLYTHPPTASVMAQDIRRMLAARTP
jgi:carboxypeptidase C (cathepsin A)